MRKINPDAVRGDFAAGLAEVEAFHSAASTALEGERNRSVLAEHTLMSAAVLWEGYVSDLFVAYINRDSARFAQHLDEAFGEALEGKAQRTFAAFGALTIPAHLTRERIVELIDPRGSNLTFRNYDSLNEGAGRYLVDAHRQGIAGLAHADRRTIDALITVRNHLAHRSEQSYRAMNSALAAGALHGTGLQRGQNEVRLLGPWLKARPAIGQPARIETFLTRLGVIAAVL